MAGRVRPTPLARLWRNFIDSFQVARRAAPTQVGEDYLGNRYFEQLKNKETGVTIRSFTSKDKELDNWEDLPPEWEAWLRKKRLDPPAVGEIEANIELMLKKQANAKLIEAKWKEEKMQNKDLLPASEPDPDAPTPFPVYPPDAFDASGSKGGGPRRRDHTIR